MEGQAGVEGETAGSGRRPIPLPSEKARYSLEAASRWLIWAGVIGAGLLLVGLTMWISWASRSQLIEGARENTRNIVQLLDQHAVRTIDSADLLVRAVESRLASVESRLASSPEGDLPGDGGPVRAVAAMAQSLPYVAAVRAFDAETERTLLSYEKQPEMGGGSPPAVDQEALDAHRGRSLRFLHLGRPFELKGRDDSWVLGASRKVSLTSIPTAASSSAARDIVIVIHLSLDYLQRFYDRIDIGNGSISLIHSNGTLIARRPYDRSNVGRNLSESPLFGELRRNSEGTYATESSVDNVRRILSYQRLDNLPLIVLSSVDQSEVLQPWVTDATRTGGMIGAVLLMLAGAGSLLVGQTGRRAQAEALQRREGAVLKATLDNMDQGLIMMDAEGRLPVHNRRASELLGLPSGLLEGGCTAKDLLTYQAKTGELDDVSPEVRPLLEPSRKEPHLTVYERRRPNGTVLEVRTAPLPEGGAVRTYTDITARKEVETALANVKDEALTAQARAESANEAKTQFLANMSHEIRTPLNAVIGFADLILTRPDLDPELRRQVELIETSGSALLTVINDILDFSKIEAGEVQLDRRPLSLPALTHNCLSIVRGFASRKGLHLTATIDPMVPGHVVGDEPRLRQILLNLLNNAIKFTTTGSVELTVRLEANDAAGGAEIDQPAIRFAVADSGIGIAADKQSKLFQNFSQADGSISREFGGTGLGLAISKRLVDLMGGRIGLHSQEGVGSTFWFSIRLEPVAARSLEAAPADGGDEPSARPLRILLAEDLEINQEIASALLKDAGHQVDVAGDGAAAVQMANSGAYDVVLMDIHMPGVDGVTATRAIRALGSAAREVPIVALTANVLPSQVAEFRKAGMNDHIGKPFKRLELLSKVALWAPRAAQPPESDSAAAGDESDPVFDEGIFGDLAETVGPEQTRAWTKRLADEIERLLLHREGDGAGDEGLIHAAHALVSQAGMLGFTALSQTCSRLEAACLEGASERSILLLAAQTRAKQAVEIVRTMSEGSASASPSKSQRPNSAAPSPP